MIGIAQNGSVMRVFSKKLDTPLGEIFVVSDEQHLLSLDFIDQRPMPAAQEEFSNPIFSIEKELKAYFQGKLYQFQTPIKLQGTIFQQQVWQELKKIPYGQTRSYADIAKAIGKPTAFRAVARANATNKLSIVIPCHRVINTGGKLGGYSGGLHRKQWFLQHEGSLQGL
jgi:O-6-methylguanine DNA methyltransferase